jgi:F-type H+-transporting ATPase subunit b
MAEPQATQTEVGHEGGSHSNFPPFDASTFPSQLLWFGLAFWFLYWFMSKRALPQIGKVIEERKARIALDLDDATAMQQKADAAAVAHEKMLAEARANAQALAQAARDQASMEAEAKRKALDNMLSDRIAEAEKQIAATRAQAMTNVAEIAHDAAGAIVERLGGRPADPAAVKAAVDQIGS